ncbi:c-type cytochrome [Lysobacter koreensis]|uniref:C-type cytochrome n=1 Tax=Lysobacter koreensis TaxID=266122 RepID=A0ABW2YJQ3_9GAMM
MTNRNVLAIALLTLLAVGCAEKAPETAGEHASAEHAEAATSSSAGLPAGNLAAGEKLASTKGAATGQSCIDCHGANGNAPIDPSYPKLGGQYHDYLAHALQNYRDGTREHALMSSQAKTLSDQQIADLSVYFGSRESSLRDLQGVHSTN